MGKVPLGPSKPSRVPEPPATRIDADLAGRQRVGPDLHGTATSHALAVGLRQPDHLDRLDAVGLDRRRGFSSNQIGDQAAQLIKIDRRDLCLKSDPLGIGQVAPPRQQVSLPVTFQAFDQVGIGRHGRLTPQSSKRQTCFALHGLAGGHRSSTTLCFRIETQELCALYPPRV